MDEMDEMNEMDKIDGFDAKGSTQVYTGADGPQDQVRTPGSNMSLRVSIGAHVCTAVCKCDGTNVSHLRTCMQACLYTSLMPIPEVYTLACYLYYLDIIINIIHNYYNTYITYMHIHVWKCRRRRLVDKRHTRCLTRHVCPCTDL